MNKSYVFFRIAALAEDQEAVGAQGIPLTSGRSLAVDRNLHVYGTPFWIDAELPLTGADTKDRFRRLMIGQDTGSAILGPARGDIYFGAGDEQGRDCRPHPPSGRVRHAAARQTQAHDHRAGCADAASTTGDAMTGESRRKRALSREEHALWRTVTAVRQTAARAAADAARELETAAAGSAERTIAAAAAPRARRSQKQPPPLTSLDRRTKQKVVRGSVAIDARIDLQGMTQERAHFALLRFVRAAHANDARLVLVITGKGARDGERGVLRRVVPHWLSLPELRASVLGFETAHVAHGGEGALYVRIRRKRE